MSLKRFNFCTNLAEKCCKGAEEIKKHYYNVKGKNGIAPESIQNLFFYDNQGYSSNKK